jgi:hypothetical protein
MFRDSFVKSLAAFVRGPGVEGWIGGWVGEWLVARIASRESWIISRELSALFEGVGDSGEGASDVVEGVLRCHVGA